MVRSDYLRERPPGPSAAKRAFDQNVVPFSIDLAGKCEVAVRRLAEWARVPPAMLMGGAAGLLLWLALRWRRA